MGTGVQPTGAGPLSRSAGFARLLWRPLSGFWPITAAMLTVGTRWMRSTEPGRVDRQNNAQQARNMGYFHRTVRCGSIRKIWYIDKTQLSTRIDSQEAPGGWGDTIVDEQPGTLISLTDMTGEK